MVRKTAHSVLHQRRIGTAEIKLAAINDVEKRLYLCAVAKKQRKITANRFSCALSERGRAS